MTGFPCITYMSATMQSAILGMIFLHLVHTLVKPGVLSGQLFDPSCMGSIELSYMFLCD